jgi:hypothetical protein
MGTRTVRDLGDAYKASDPSAAHYDSEELGRVIRQEHPEQFRDVIDPRSEAMSNTPGYGESFARGLAQWGSMGFSDEAAGAKAKLAGRDYKLDRDRARARDDEAWTDHPVSYGLGAAASFIPTLGGGLLARMAKGGQAATEASAKVAPKLLARIGRAGVEGGGLGAVGGLGNSRADDLEGTLKDVGIGAAGGTLLHGAGQGVSVGLNKVRDALAHGSQRLFVQGLAPAAGESTELANRFDPKGISPRFAADPLRAMKTPEGGAMLPTFASHETRAGNVQAVKEAAGAAKGAILKEATEKGATVDLAKVLDQAKKAAGETVGDPNNFAVRGSDDDKAAQALLDRVKARFDRPTQVVGVSRVSLKPGDALVPTGEGTIMTPDAEAFGAKPRLIGAEEQQAGKNLSPRKREILRYPEPDPAASGGKKFGPTKDSTTRPAPDTGWEPDLVEGQPFTAHEADQLAQWLEQDVRRQAAQAVTPSAVREIQADPSNRFKKTLAAILRGHVEESVGEALGPVRREAFKTAKATFGTAATVEPMTTGKEQATVTRDGPHTTGGLKHMIPARSYLPQVGAAAVDKLSGLAGVAADTAPITAKMLTQMLTSKRRDLKKETDQ